MTDQPKRKSSLARSTQLPNVERSLDAFVARANEQLSEVAAAVTLETRESREDELRSEVDKLQAQQAELQAQQAELESQIASRRRRSPMIAVAAFVLGAGAMFAIDVARSPSHEASVAPSAPQAAVEPPRAAPPAPAAPAPPPAAPVVTPVPDVAPAAPAPPPPAPIAARPTKKKPPTKPASPGAPTPAKPPADDTGLFNPF